MSDMQDETGRQPGSNAATGATPAGNAAPGSTPPPNTAPTGTGTQAGAGMNRGAATQAGTGTMTGTAAGAGTQGNTAQNYVPRPTPGYDDAGRYEGRHADSTPPSGAAVGLTILAATLMMVSGLLGFFYGLAAIIKGSFFVVLPNYAFSLSAVGWGWLHLAIGAVVFVAGAALFTGHLWARIAGVVIASLAIVAYFVSLPYYPVWSVVVIALSAFIIWALLTPRNPIR
jgi:hypothetical protein